MIRLAFLSDLPLVLPLIITLKNYLSKNPHKQFYYIIFIVLRMIAGDIIEEIYNIIMCVSDGKQSVVIRMYNG